MNAISRNLNDELGTETEAERQLKILLDKQLDKNITLNKQKERQRSFTSSGPYKPFTEEVAGAHSLTEFLSVKNSEQYRDELRQSGLTDDEINFFLQEINQKEGQPVQKKQKLTLEPDAAKKCIELIYSKLKHRDENATQQFSFSGTKPLTRHEMDIEKSLYAGCKVKENLKDVLIANKQQQELHPLDPFRAVGELSKKLMRFRRNKNKKNRKDANSNDDNISANTTTIDTANDGDDCFRTAVSESSSCDGQKPDVATLHVVVPLERSEIEANRLSIEQIRGIPRFKDYEPGIPNKVLYLKNLHPSIDVRSLVAIFSRFDPVDGDPVSYRLLSGRMKGQAFVTFPDVETAKIALELANGYVLRGKPLIIAYGKVKT